MKKVTKVEYSKRDGKGGEQLRKRDWIPAWRNDNFVQHHHNRFFIKTHKASRFPFCNYIDCSFKNFFHLFLSLIICTSSSNFLFFFLSTSSVLHTFGFRLLYPKGFAFPMFLTCLSSLILSKCPNQLNLFSCIISHSCILLCFTKFNDALYKFKIKI